jgi:hypothetical protein
MAQSPLLEQSLERPGLQSAGEMRWQVQMGGLSQTLPEAARRAGPTPISGFVNR